jgi:ribulose 1,5-bisphosphate synthetase/thiazole synthase
LHTAIKPVSYFVHSRETATSTSTGRRRKVAERFDLVIIGSGNAGYIPAIRASQVGMNVAIIEKVARFVRPKG